MQDALELALLEPSAQIDWESIQIEYTWEHEGREEIASEHAIYVHMGLDKEDEREKNIREKACNNGSDSDDQDDYLAAMPIDDIRQDEIKIMHDKRNPIMEAGSLYPSMVEFRLAVRQYAIINEFELRIISTCITRYTARCIGSPDCPWRIHGIPQMKGLPTIKVCSCCLSPIVTVCS